MRGAAARTDNLFSLCGLNCAFCPMQVRGECGGCGSDSLCYSSCHIVHCAARHGNIDYCFECPEYPCEKYEGVDRYDSLISHKNQKKDMDKAKEMGIKGYLESLHAKKAVLSQLLAGYDDGRHDVLFCLAANLLELDDLTDVLSRARQLDHGVSQREKAAFVERELHAHANERGISLALRR